MNETDKTHVSLPIQFEQADGFTIVTFRKKSYFLEEFIQIHSRHQQTVNFLNAVVSATWFFFQKYNIKAPEWFKERFPSHSQTTH
ncbi:MAG: hypothetical protein OXR68_00690 [Alphaproteobacteria bacterium]|nr:hypothetical protein [Alphaproteobacteria bacterium]